MLHRRLNISCAVLGLLCAVLLMNGTPASTQAQDDQPVEQTRKNIQVLKGLPESQLFMLMNFVSDSLDVKCDYCHVKNGKNAQGGDNWLWDRDDKPAKLAGRRMMKMVLDINQANFNGETRVTCYSCHRGRTDVARLPPLPPHEAVHDDAPLPAAEEIITKYANAVGGKDATAKTIVLKGTVERSEGRNAQFEITLKDSDKYLISLTSPQGVAMQAVNGETGWQKSSAGSKKLTGPVVDQVRRVAGYFAVIKVTGDVARMRVTGTEKIGNRETYVVAHVVDPETTIRYYFDTQTGLLLRELITKQTLLAPLPEQVDFEDYRDVNGVKLPFVIRTSDSAPYDNATRKFTDIKLNVTVDDSIFNFPSN